MSVREALLALALVIASGLIVAGVQRWSTEVAFILAGLLVAVVAYVFLAEDDAARDDS